MRRPYVGAICEAGENHGNVEPSDEFRRRTPGEANNVCKRNKETFGFSKLFGDMNVKVEFGIEMNAKVFCRVFPGDRRRAHREGRERCEGVGGFGKENRNRFLMTERETVL